MPRDRVYVKAAQVKHILRAAGEQPVAVKLDKDSGGDMDGLQEVRDVMVRTGNDRCILVIDMTINNHCVEAVVDSEAQLSVLSRIFYDSLSCRPRPVESIRLRGASASGVMVGCRVDGVEVDLGDGYGNNMSVVIITRCFFSEHYYLNGKIS